VSFESILSFYIELKPLQISYRNFAAESVTMPSGKQIQKTHLVCVVCGKGFSSTYDEELSLFPKYHPRNEELNSGTCESQFYEALLRIYHYIHHNDSSVQFSEIINSLDWGEIQLRKEAVNWCLSLGYLSADALKRIIIPPEIDDITKELFTSENLADPEFAIKAMEYLKSVFKVFKDKLKPSSIEDEWEGSVTDEEENDLEEKRKRRQSVSRMFTANVSGVEERNQERNRTRGSGMHSLNRS